MVLLGEAQRASEILERMAQQQTIQGGRPCLSLFPCITRFLQAGLLGQDDVIPGHIQWGRFSVFDALLQIYRNNFILGSLRCSPAATPAWYRASGWRDLLRGCGTRVRAGGTSEEGSVMDYGRALATGWHACPPRPCCPGSGIWPASGVGLERVSLLAPETRHWPAERLAAMTPEHWERLVLHPACG